MMQDCLAYGYAVADAMQKVYKVELGPEPVPLTMEGELVDEEDVSLCLLSPSYLYWFVVVVMVLTIFYLWFWSSKRTWVLEQGACLDALVSIMLDSLANQMVLSLIGPRL